MALIILYAIVATFKVVFLRLIEEECLNIDRCNEGKDGLYTDTYDEEKEPFEYKFPMLSLGSGYSFGAVQDHDFVYQNQTP